MSRTEKAGDIAEYVLGGPLFIVVSAATAAVMAVGLLLTPVIERLVHH